jgi:membrane-bound lytic murein transglycosylase B
MDDDRYLNERNDRNGLSLWGSWCLMCDLTGFTRMNRMKCCACVIAFLALCLPSMARPQDRASIETNFQAWLEDSVWPRANSVGVKRQTYDAALSNVDLNWDLPDSVIPGEPDEVSEVSTHGST